MPLHLSCYPRRKCIWLPTLDWIHFQSLDGPFSVVRKYLIAHFHDGKVGSWHFQSSAFFDLSHLYVFPFGLCTTWLSALTWFEIRNTATKTNKTTPKSRAIVIIAILYQAKGITQKSLFWLDSTRTAFLFYFTFIHLNMISSQ